MRSLQPFKNSWTFHFPGNRRKREGGGKKRREKGRKGRTVICQRSYQSCYCVTDRAQAFQTLSALVAQSTSFEFLLIVAHFLNTSASNCIPPSSENILSSLHYTTFQTNNVLENTLRDFLLLVIRNHFFLLIIEKEQKKRISQADRQLQLFYASLCRFLCNLSLAISNIRMDFQIISEYEN